jgi:hypothetical protein
MNTLQYASIIVAPKNSKKIVINVKNGYGICEKYSIINNIKTILEELSYKISLVTAPNFYAPKG